jgi:hypothetical protein
VRSPGAGRRSLGAGAALLLSPVDRREVRFPGRPRSPSVLARPQSVMRRAFARRPPALLRASRGTQYATKVARDVGPCQEAKLRKFGSHCGS